MNNPLLFVAFDFFVIAAAQSALLLLITAPTYVFVVVAYARKLETFGLPDLVFSRAAFFFIIIEYFADQQQWNFQSAKKEYQKTARIPEPYKDLYTPEDLERGFVVSGLWSWSRHPNFVAEQAIWVTLYLWCAYRTGIYLQWTVLGAVGYLLLFQASTRITEYISASRYPEYGEYQARVGRFIPRWSVEAKKTKRSSKKPVVEKPKAKKIN